MKNIITHRCGWFDAYEPKSIFISSSRYGPERKKKAPAKGRGLNILERKTGLEPATYGLEGQKIPHAYVFVYDRKVR